MNERASLSRASRELYVGWRKNTPSAVWRLLRVLIALFFFGAMLIAAMIARNQSALDPGVFRFGETTSVEGVLRAIPYPHLEVDSAVARKNLSQIPNSSYLLVDQGKFGAQDLVRAFDGQRVRLQGSLIARGDFTMVELSDEIVPLVPGPPPPTPLLPVDLGAQEMIGEIVDAKCYLGAMKPGRGSVHRACAVRCLAGGLPMAFAVPGIRSDGSPGADHIFILLDQDGETIAPSSDFLALAGRPVKVKGRIFRRGRILEVHADPGLIEPWHRESTASTAPRVRESTQGRN